MPEIEDVPDLYRLAYMPGCFRCPQCGFYLTKQNRVTITWSVNGECINVSAQVIGTREQDRNSEPCPNDGTMMVHVSYREQLEVYSERLKEEFNRFEMHTKAVAEFLNELWAIMVDPLADGVRTVAETMEGLRNAAIEAREREHPPGSKSSKTIEQLIAEQNVEPINDLSDLSGAIPDEDVDEFVADIYRARG